MRIVGFDLGEVTLGIALSDSAATIAFAKETLRYERGDLNTLATKAIEYLDSVKSNEAVLGLPRHMNGDLSKTGELVLEFKEELLKLRPDLKIELWDERLTTKMALKTIANTKTKNKAQKRKERVDSLAACNILQSYLDRK